MQTETNRLDKADESTEEIVDSRQRILAVAEALYMKHGYRAVSLRDIANALSIKQASLYYHFPDGKEQLFEAVVEHAFHHHKIGIEQAIAACEGDLRQQFLALIHWFASQAPMNLVSMIHTDMPALQPERMKELEKSAHSALFLPIMMMFVKAMQRGEIRQINPAVMAGLMLSIISGLRYGSTQVPEAQRPAMYEELVDIFMQGLYPR